MPTRSIHAAESGPGVDLLRLLVLAVVGSLAALLADPRVMAETPLEPPHMVWLALALAGVWLFVDLVEKQRFRSSRTAARESASTIVHRSGELSRAVFPLVAGGVVAVLLALPLGGFCNRLVGSGEAGSLGAILLTAGLAVGTAKLVTIARYGLRCRTLTLAADALILDGHRQRKIPWSDIDDARLVLVRRWRSSVPYLALALADPARYGLRPVSLWHRWTASGALQGDALLTNLDIFLDRPEQIVEDVRRFIRRRDEQASG